MHLPSAELRQELLSVPTFARINMSLGRDGFEPTLIIKASTLTLKYIIRRGMFKLNVQQLPSGKILYVVIVDEYDERPLCIWATVETEEELSALGQIFEGKPMPVFLFNEACVNVAHATALFEQSEDLEAIIRRPLVFSDRIRNEEDSSEATTAMDEFISDEASEASLTTKDKLTWSEVQNHYITNQLRPSPIGILSENEGDQQEEICNWLVDTLTREGAFLSPQVHELSKPRELTDILLNYLGGCMLVESKTLAVLDRDELPARSKLRKNVLKNIAKALSQLPGACRNVAAGLKVTSQRGEVIPITPDIAPHCIILVPELGLLSPEDDLGGKRLTEFMRENGAYLHFLDPSELLRLVQTALHRASLSQRRTPILAFDVVLLERWQRAVKHESPNFTMITHFVDALPDTADD